MIGAPSGYVESLPNSVRNRVSALQDLQKDHNDLEEQYRKERAILDAKYRAFYGENFVMCMALIVTPRMMMSKLASPLNQNKRNVLRCKA